MILHDFDLRANVSETNPTFAPTSITKFDEESVLTLRINFWPVMYVFKSESLQASKNDGKI